MKALHEKVNIVPVLAKADTLTPSEVKKKKMKASMIPVIKKKFNPRMYLNENGVREPFTKSFCLSVSK